MVSFIFYIAMFFSIQPLLGINPQPRVKREPFFKNDLVSKLDCWKIGSAVVGIDGPTIYDMLWLVNEINFVEIGRKNPKTQEFEKKYTFNDHHICLHDLVVAEEALQVEFEQRKEHIRTQNAGNLDVCAQELVALDKEFAAKNADLQKTLIIIKSDFLSKTLGFMKQIRLLKAFVCELIDEWCMRRDHNDSFLREWSRMDTNEKEEFNIHMDSAKKLELFLTHLKGFLVDLIYSCPNAYQEFLDNKEIYAAHSRR